MMGSNLNFYTNFWDDKFLHLALSSKVEDVSNPWPSNSTRGFREILVYVFPKLWTKQFIAVLFLIVPNWK